MANIRLIRRMKNFDQYREKKKKKSCCQIVISRVYSLAIVIITRFEKLELLRDLDICD